MRRSTPQNLPRNARAWLVLATASVLLSGCLSAGQVAGPKPPADADDIVLNLRMGVGSVATLNKSAVISLDRMVVVMSSSANDTIRDTITTTTTPALSPVSTTGQTIQKNYDLKALRSWKITVTSFDVLDSIIHRDSATIPVLYAGDSVGVNLNLSSRFAMYEARFLSLPDSIQSATPGQPKQELCIDRLVLEIDSTPVRDSTSSGPCFAALTTHVLSYDYVETGTRQVRLLAYGPMNHWDVALPLFDGSTNVNVGAGADSTVALNLAWVGPTTGSGNLEVQLGRVGKVTVNGTLPGTVMP